MLLDVISLSAREGESFGSQPEINDGIADVDLTCTRAVHSEMSYSVD